LGQYFNCKLDGRRIMSNVTSFMEIWTILFAVYCKEQLASISAHAWSLSQSALCVNVQYIPAVLSMYHGILALFLPAVHWRQAQGWPVGLTNSSHFGHFGDVLGLTDKADKDHFSMMLLIAQNLQF